MARQQVALESVIARAVRSHHFPPETYFVIGALFRYVGPAFAVLLFAHVAPLGVAWLRITSAALVFAFWKRPWRMLIRLDHTTRKRVVLLGIVLAAMNSVFYLAIERLPLSTVSAVEFLGVIALAAAGARTPRNAAALLLAVIGVYLLTEIRIEGARSAYLLAFANCPLLMLYVVLGHRIARTSDGRGVEMLSPAMSVAALVAMPFGVAKATPAFHEPLLLGAAVGVGICSSVIPYTLDQLAMARLPRATFALMLTLLPATATAVGLVVLAQVPTALELVGIGLVILGLGVHRTGA